MKNIAFIDGQNLYLGTSKCKVCASDGNIDFEKIKLQDCSCGKAWKIDFFKFRKYLKDQYKIDEAYYFLGTVNEDYQDLYTNIQKSGFILMFREHSQEFKGKKKGNVDTDIVFDIMKTISDNGKEYANFLLVTGDGDYYKLVRYLIENNIFIKILFPNNNYSSLYHKVDNKYKLNLERIKSKIEHKI